jgi:hypothetical protein
MPDDRENTSLEPLPDEAMVVAFSSPNHDGEMEAMAVKGVLESNNIPVMIVGPHMLPNLEFQVQVPAHLLEEAQRLIREARQAGPEAAAEAENQTEGQNPGSG